MDLAQTFGAPYIEIIDGAEVSFPLMEMDDYAKCCQAIKANLRMEAEKRLIASGRTSQGERDAANERIDKEIITLSYACAYRTETPEGIRSTLSKSLKASGKSDEEIAALIKKIPPVKQQQIAKRIADPPIADPKSAGDTSKNEQAAIETGTSTPPSSESTGASTPDA